MKRIYIVLLACCAMIACKRIDVDFTISTDAPKAGEKVTFTNTSTGGEDWAWSFGDGISSTLKSPSHIFKRPGKYTVSLKVDNKSSLVRVKELTVYDTIPSFTCEDTTFYVFKDYTFTASVYNPYNYKVEYQWLFPINTEYVKVTDTVLTNSSLHLYFTKPMKEAPLALVIILNGDTTNVQKNFLVEDQATNSVLFRTTEADMRQRIFGEKAEEAKADNTAKELLDVEQDTFQVYNGYAFYLSDMQTLFQNLQGFHIANRKFYYRADGLWIANIDGTNQVQIDSLDCYAMTLDKKDNRIYWANEKGVWYMPFIGSDNNKFVTVPVQLNTLTDVTLIAADNELK